jgi:vancomycin permeability regulator SanA
MSRFFKKFIWLSACVLAALLCMASVIAVEGLTEKLAVGDMVVVPGNTVNPDGTLSPRLKARLDAAFVLFKDGNCAIIFVSGGTGKEGVDEAVAMKTYLVSLGVPAEDIIQDSLGVNTQATAQHAAAVLNSRNLTTVIATSQFFHITRLRMLLERSGVDVVGTTYARFFELRDVYSLLREVAAVFMLWMQVGVS